MRKTLWLPGVAAIALGGAAQAQTPGWYVEGGFGISFDGEQDLVADASGSLLGSPFSAGARFDQDPDLGYAGAARIGYAWENGLRFEGEVTYRAGSGEISPIVTLSDGTVINLDTDLDFLTGGDLNIDLESDTQVLAGLANLYYDFGGLTDDWAITPYIGIGAGIALIDNDVTISGSFNDGGGTVVSGSISGDGAELAPAGQLIAGVTVPIDNNWSFGVDYRYFRVFAGDIEHDRIAAAVPSIPFSFNGSLAVDGDYQAHSIMAALRYSFGGSGRGMEGGSDGPNGMQPVGYTDRGWYVEGAGGLSFAGEQDLIGQLDATGVLGPGATSDSVRFDQDPDIGYVVAARAGYGWANGLRFEGEIAYHSTSGDVSPLAEVCLSGIGCQIVNLDTVFDSLVDGLDVNVDIQSETQALASLANVYYDFLDVQDDWGFTPYVGLGAGVALVDNDIDIGVNGAFPDIGIPGGPPIPGGPFSAIISGDGAELAPAGQLIAGINVPIDDHWSVSVDYRYFRAFTGDIEHNELAVAGPTFAANGTLAVDGDFQSHNVMAALRYTWGEPIYEAPPAPAPEPAVVQSEFMVFFDWDESVLTPEANNTLDQVVIVYDENGFAQVNLAGHTDTSGPADYNLDLGLRRAESVRQGLVGRGVAPDEIVVRSFGETDLLVPTPDGVREPQNRRVEIVLM